MHPADMEGVYDEWSPSRYLPRHQNIVYWRDFITLTLILIALPYLVRTLIKNPSAAVSFAKVK